MAKEYDGICITSDDETIYEVGKTYRCKVKTGIDIGEAYKCVEYEEYEDLEDENKLWHKASFELVDESKSTVDNNTYFYKENYWVTWKC